MKKIFLTCLFFLLPFTFLISLESEKLVILGSGPAGLTAAIYAGRGEWNPIVIEGDKPGGQALLAQKIENFPGFPDGISGIDLIERLNKQAKKFGARFLRGNVVNVDLACRPFCVRLDEGQDIFCDSLIIATGTSPKWLGIPSEASFKGRGVYTCSICDGYKFKGKDVVVVGGGDIAVHQAMALSKIAKKVTMIFEQPQLSAAKYLRNLALECANITYISNASIEDLCYVDDYITGAKLRNHLLDRQEIINCQGIFVAIGRHPNTDLFLGQLNLDEDGYILTNKGNTITSVPGVFAAGNVADKQYHQVITASAFGCQAALDANEFLLETE